jgi:Zn-dependent M28 family amino/carboxypeptidase
LFDGEERGLQGSAAFVDHVQQGATPFGNVTFRGAIDVDMYGIGWPSVQTPYGVSFTSETFHTLADESRVALGVPDNMMAYGSASGGGGSDFASFVAAEVPTVFFSSDMGQEGIPGSGAIPADVPTAPGFYPFWHVVDTWETMTLMAGGAQQLADSFEVAAQIESDVLYGVAVEGQALEG